MVKNFIASKGSASIDLLFNWATAVGRSLTRQGQIQASANKFQVFIKAFPWQSV
jgi:hypothetical protein